LLLGLLTGAIVAPATLLVGREIVLLSVVAIFYCCCFGGVAAFAPAAVGFVVVVCCDGGNGDDDDTADVGGVADGAEGGFTVFGMSHIRASVVL
jgi:hypothetical protein